MLAIAGPIVTAQYVFYTQTELRNALVAWMGADNEVARQNFGDVNTWDVSRLTSMSHLFHAIPGASAFNDNIGDWNVSSVTDMSDMMDDCSTFNADISNWDVSRVTTSMPLT